MLAALSFASSSWWIWATVVFIGSAVLLAKMYRAPGTAFRLRVIARGLKLLAFAVLALSLLEPVWSGTHPKPKANVFLTAVDNSQSLNVRWSGGGTLADAVKQVLQPAEAANWLTRLEQDFDLQRFLFDRRVRQVADFKGFNSQGEHSSLQGMLKELTTRFRGRPVGGMLLLSDGNASDLTDADIEKLADECRSLGPIFPVVWPGQTAAFDVAIDNVAVSETSFEDAPITVQCDLRVTGSERQSGKQLRCQLLDAAGEVVEEQRQPMGKSGERKPFRFQLRPKQAGLSFYQLVATAEPDGSAANAPAVTEVTTANNQRVLAIDRGANQHRVLYVSGCPNWEFKFLRRAVEDDDYVDLVGMIRIAKREAKFDFRGRDGQSSNSLFRGFKSEADADTERYDEPVLVRLNTKTPDELRAGFPKAADELFPFDAIILDDIEAGFFTRDQLTLLERFVSERGGGLLMLGGLDSFQSGGYERTPVADLLPVYLDRVAFPDGDAQLKFDLTTEGWLQPWTRLRSTEDAERLRLRQMPGFRSLNAVRGVKPGASILATASDPAGKQWPALVTQQFGRGHAGALLIGDLWRWQLLPSESPATAQAGSGAPGNDRDSGRKRDQGDVAKCWRQMVRWLVADVAGRVTLKQTPAPEVSAEAMRLRVRVVDPEFHPLDNARVRLRVRPVSMPNSKTDAQTDEPSKTENSDATITLDAEASDNEPGVYSAVFVPSQVGGYEISASGSDPDGKDLPATQLGIVHDPLSTEFRSVGINLPLLEKLAAATGGKVIKATELDEFVSGLRSQQMPVMESWSMSLWDRPFVFVLLLACLVGEWSLRRLSGLP